MAIQRTGAPGENNLDLEVNNGDLRVLREIARDWGFRDEESVFRFALAVLSKTKRQILYYESEEGEKIGVQPSEALKKPQVDATKTP